MDWPASVSFHSSDPTIARRWNAGLSARDRSIVATRDADPFVALDAIDRELRMGRRAGRNDRWSGFVSYEANRWVESLPPRRADVTGLPVLAFWQTAGQTMGRSSARSPTVAPVIVRRSMTRDAYVAAVRRAMDYIAAGDVFQINLAQSFDVKTSRHPYEVWQALQHDAPARYGAWIDFGDVVILSNSPELFFRIEPLADGRRRITTRPIKGTRPRGLGMRDALERSAKDRAELAMIVDLERNDLGRICEIGSVRVVEPRAIEEHPTLYHGVATIEGLLRPDVTLADVFRAMFPCGSITGCPKVRAMEIIDELERMPRGPYCGAIGYVDSDGSAEFSVAIRTMTLRDGIARVSVGGGIVADSDPVEEHRETIVKARAMLRALGVVEADIDALDRE